MAVTPHHHELAATWMMRVLDYDTLHIGCHECGPQWVVTLNWVDHTFMVAWVHVPWTLYFDSRDRRITIDTDARNDLGDAT